MKEWYERECIVLWMMREMEVLNKINYSIEIVILFN
jgi:hypothetical protein